MKSPDPCCSDCKQFETCPIVKKYDRVYKLIDEWIKMGEKEGYPSVTNYYADKLKAALL